MLSLILGMVMTDEEMKPGQQPVKAGNLPYRLDLFLTCPFGQAEGLHLLRREVSQRIKAVSRHHQLITPHLDQRARVTGCVTGRGQQPHGAFRWHVRRATEKVVIRPPRPTGNPQSTFLIRLRPLRHLPMRRGSRSSAATAVCSSIG
jgi:hypothetical protein